jgi:hypothetical protein
MPNDMGPVAVSFPSSKGPFSDEQRSAQVSARSTLQMHLKANPCVALTIEISTPFFKGNDLVPIRSITCADGEPSAFNNHHGQDHHWRLEHLF